MKIVNQIVGISGLVCAILMMVKVEEEAWAEIVSPSDAMPVKRRKIRKNTTAIKGNVFWCETCATKLASATQALSHFRGKAHKKALNQTARETLKRPLSEFETNTSSSEGNGPCEEKKSKSEPISCIECGVLLNSPLMAEKHNQGKKHLSNVARLEAAKKSAEALAQCEKP